MKQLFSAVFLITATVVTVAAETLRFPAPEIQNLGHAHVVPVCPGHFRPVPPGSSSSRPLSGCAARSRSFPFETGLPQPISAFLSGNTTGCRISN